MNAPSLLGTLALGLLLSGTVAADTLVMRDGRSLVGQFIGSTARSVHLRTSKGIERYSLNEVESIRLEPRPKVSERDASASGNESTPRALIVGQGQSQSIERVRTSN